MGEYCNHEPVSLDRLDERVKRLEGKTHLGDVFAIAALVVLVSLLFAKPDLFSGLLKALDG